MVIKDLRPELERHWQSPYQDVRRHLASIKTNVILVVKRELDALGISNPHFFEDKPLARLACTGYADETTRKTDPITIMSELSCQLGLMGRCQALSTVEGSARGLACT